MNCMAFSQGLKPRIEQVGKDTFFCFNLVQSREIAKQIEEKIYCDSINTGLETEIALLNAQTCNRDSTILLLQLEGINHNLIISNQEGIIANVNSQLKQTQRKYKWQLWQKRLFAVGVIVLVITSIIKK